MPFWLFINSTKRSSLTLTKITSVLAVCLAVIIATEVRGQEASVLTSESQSSGSSESILTDFTANLPETDSLYTNSSDQLQITSYNSTSVFNNQITGLYPALNYNYYNTFTSAVYDDIRALQIRNLFLKNVPRSDGRIYDYTQIPIIISADYMFSSNGSNTITYKGNVSIIQGDRIVKSDEVIYNRELNGKQTIEIKGSTALNSNALVLDSQQVVIEIVNDNQSIINSDKSTFKIVDTILHGQANKLTQSGKDTDLENASLYAGPIEPLTLNIKSTNTKVDMQEERINFKNATLRIGKIPLMWFPYFSINISGRPTTGFKEPSFSLNNTAGLQLTVPFVWYINNNLKYTIKTTYASKLGVLFNNTLDYRWNYGITTLNYAVVPAFLNRVDNHMRYYLALRHLANFNDDYKLSLNYRYVRDKQFFYDFYNNTDSYLMSNYSLSYNKNNWRWDLSAFTFQPIYNTLSRSYDSVPEFNFAYLPEFKYDKLRFKMYGQLAHLQNNQAPIYTKADRGYLKGALKYSTINTVWRSDYSAGGYIHLYHQYNKRTGEYENLKRFSPEFTASFSSKIVRDEPLFDKYNVNVTPSISYTYRKIGNRYNTKFQTYDSASLVPSILMLQRGIYSTGIDRLEDANDVSLGYNLEYINRFTGLEKLKISLNLTQSLNKLKYYNPNSDVFYNRVKRNLVSNVHFNIANNFNFDTINIIDLTKNNSSMGVVSLNYQPNLTNIVQFNYRYATKQYLDDALISNYGDGIKQVGIAFVWDLTPRFSVMMSNYVDVHKMELVDRVIAFNYVNYGWSVGVSYERKRVAPNRFENGFDFVLNLVGFNNNYNSRFGKFINSGKLPFVGNR